MKRRSFLTGLGGLALVTLPARQALAAIPKRIVTAGGAMTEIVCALGVGDSIVAVDTTSLYPPRAVAPLPKIGYLRNLSAEGLLSTRPDLILADSDAGPPDVFDQLRRMGAPVAHFAGHPSARSVIDKISFVGAALSTAEKSADMAARYAADLALLQQAVAGLTVRPKVLFLMAAGATGLRAAGRDTGAAEMLALAGAVNAMQDLPGYKPLSSEAALAADPDAILLMQQSLDALGGIDGVAALPALSKLRAAKERRIIAMDGAYLLGFGPRTAHAGRDLAVALHPEVSVPSLPARPWTQS
jgi:iron complex transport system substrate-binding protein